MAASGPVALAPPLLEPHAGPRLLNAASKPAIASQGSAQFWRPPAVAADGLTSSRLATAIRSAPEGVLLLNGALEAPFAAIEELFEEKATPEVAARANAAYKNGTSRLIFKDSWGEGRCAWLAWRCRAGRRCVRPAAVIVDSDLCVLCCGPACPFRCHPAGAARMWT